MRLFFLLLSFCLLAAGVSYARGPDAVPAAQVLVDKSDAVMIAYDADGKEIRRYTVTLGQVPGPKEREGDLKTPIGDYMLAPARRSQRWGVFFEIDYPNAQDIARAKANGIPVKKLGGQIGIHGTGSEFWKSMRQSFGEQWTLGCIAMKNNDLRDFIWRVRHDIPIRIQP